MICPKCHNEISDTALRCPICNTKLKMFCPQCRSLIKFGIKTCNICGYEILKKCKNCGAINLANENICRKCKKPINIKMEVATQPTKFDSKAKNKNPLHEEIQQNKNVEIKKEQEENKSPTDTSEEKELNVNPAEIFEINITETKEETQTATKEEKIENDAKYYEQPEAKDRLYAALKDDNKYIVSLSGQNGFGKSTIIKQLIPTLNKDNISVLYSECSPNTQLSTYGAIQEIFRKYLAIPEFYATDEIFEKAIKPIISSAFSFLNKQEFLCICNFLYPTEQAYYENIIINQQNVHEILDKIILKISEIYPLVIIIDSFELIDAASYKYIMGLIKRGIINKQVKLLLSYRDNIQVQSYLNFINEEENIYENVYLKNLSHNNFNELIKFFLNGSNPLPEGITKQIIKHSDYNAGYCEQAVFYLNDLNAFVAKENDIEYSTEAYDIQIPETYEKLVEARINNLKTASVLYYEFLIVAALLGSSFNAQLVQNILNIDDSATNEIINLLINSGYILPNQNTDLLFRNTRFWKTVYDIAKNDGKYLEFNKRLHDLLSQIKYYNLSIKALFAQNIEENFIAFSLWTQNIKTASAVGDIDLYILSQKQCLKLLNDFTHTNNAYITNNIHERIGKLVYKSNPMEATDFLTNAMATYHQNGNILKTIELSGFLLKSQKMTDNALAIIEIVDNVLRIMPEKGYELEKALIKAKKTDALFKIGNFDELINLIRNEIIPTLEENLAKSTPHKRYSHELLFNVWINTAICEANAYTYQGNDKSLEVINTIEEVLKANDKFDSSRYKDRIELAKASAYTLKGQLEFSDEILNTISPDDNTLNQEISMIYLVRIINKLLKLDFVNIKDDLFEAATFANNCNNIVLKNIFKVLLAKLLKEDGNAQKAMDIFNEQITYFADEKISVGAFLCWYFMTEIYLLTDGPDKALEIAMKSLEITKNPKISNFIFMIMYKKLIAEICIIKKDFETAKMYIEKALLMARKFGLDYLIMILYHLYGKYFEEIVTSKTSDDINMIKNSFKMYEKSNDIAKELDIEKYIINNENAKKSLQVFCQLNNISVD